MAMVNGDDIVEASAEELLDAQAHVWNHTFSFINSMALKCAVQLGIPDIIYNHGKPITLSQLVASLPIPTPQSHCIRRLMRLLIHSKLFLKLEPSRPDHDMNDQQLQQEEEEDLYWLTPASRLLLRDAPFTLAPFVLLVLDPVWDKPLHCLSEWLVGEPSHHASAFEMAHGRPVWEHMGQEPRFHDAFSRGMSCDTRFAMHLLLNHCKHIFEGIELLVDVGGGTGTTAKAILDASPAAGMECVVFDLQHVVAGLEGTKNLTYVGGDMFESIPPGDAILLKWILHNWDDESCIKILKNCKEAINGKNKEKRKVIIIDIVLHDDAPNCGDSKVTEVQLFYDMAMLAYTNGKERSEKEWVKLFSEAGFTRYEIIPSLGVRSLIVLYH